MDNIVFFHGGMEPLLRIVVVGTLAYFSLIFLLRLLGKRTLAQLNAFDFVITIAIGSTLGRLITAKGVSLTESITAFFDAHYFAISGFLADGAIVSHRKFGHSDPFSAVFSRAISTQSHARTTGDASAIVGRRAGQ